MAGFLSDPISFENIPDWEDDNHADALQAFYKSALLLREKRPKQRQLGISSKALGDISDWLFHLDEGVLGTEARYFFESHFVPRLVNPDKNGTVRTRGFVTGYYEPEVSGSRTKSSRFKWPLFKRPSDLVSIFDIPEAARLDSWDPEMRFVRQLSGGYEPYFDRRAISGGALDGQGLEIVYLESPIDVFFIHVQGSARIRLDDGSIMRVTYAAKSGHAYTAIGRILIDRGEVAREDMSMQAIRTWLSSHPDQQDEIMGYNRSYIFFEEIVRLDPEDGPVGAGKVSLTAGRSLAVDRLMHIYGTPIFLKTDLPDSFNRLMIAQDTGSAIVGPARGDIYFGSGDLAEAQAGSVQHAADFYLLWPRHQPV